MKKNLSKISLLVSVFAIALIALWSFSNFAWADDSKILKDLDEATKTSKFHFDSLTPEVIQRSSNQKLLEVYSVQIWLIIVKVLSATKTNFPIIMFT